MQLTEKESEILFLKNEGFKQERIETDSNFRHTTRYRISGGKLYFEYEYFDRLQGTASQGRSKCDEELTIQFAEKHYDVLNQADAECEDTAHEENVEQDTSSEAVESFDSVLDPMKICELTAQKAGVTVEQITNKKYRSLDVVKARNVFIYLCRRYTPLPFGQIGKLLGYKECAIIIREHNKIEQQLPCDPKLRFFS